MSAPSGGSRPTLAYAIATSLGLGFMPVAPGTWGSAVGVALATGLAVAGRARPSEEVLLHCAILTIALAVTGLWASTRVARFARASDPQFVVIDEVSGQTIALVLGSALTAAFWRPPLGDFLGATFASAFAHNLRDWKYLLAGFIIFRVFDIWKPFPARNAESLHGGLGIMADDWIAGTYGALALCVARYGGL